MGLQMKVWQTSNSHVHQRLTYELTHNICTLTLQSHQVDMGLNAEEVMIEMVEDNA